MLNLHPELNTPLVAAGESFAVATIVGTSGSTPHPLGTSMIIHARGAITGSLSGGCIDSAVHAAALDSLADHQARHEHYGYSPENALAAGLTCGGEIDVHITPCTGDSSLAVAVADYSRFLPTDPVAIIRRIDSGSAGAVLIPNPAFLNMADLVELLGPLLDSGHALAAALCAPLLAGGRSGTISLEPDGGRRLRGSAQLLVESRLATPRMLVFGANSFAEELLKLAPILGYRSTLCDARSAFTLQPRFNTADEISTRWPHDYLAGEIAAGRIDERTVLCVLTHDPKFDTPLLKLALTRPLAYLGAMGSRTSHENRMRELRAEGVGEAALLTLRSPIGLDLQALTPGEVAVSIAAEIIASRSRTATGARLSALAGPIHTRTHTSTGQAFSPVPHTQEEPSWT